MTNQSFRKLKDVNHGQTSTLHNLPLRKLKKVFCRLINEHEKRSDLVGKSAASVAINLDANTGGN